MSKSEEFIEENCRLAPRTADPIRRMPSTPSIIVSASSSCTGKSFVRRIREAAVVGGGSRSRTR